MTAYSNEIRSPKWRRIVTTTAACAALIVAFAGQPQASVARRAAHPKPNILLVGGAFVDGSSWSAVTRHRQADGYNVVASQIPLT